MLHFLHETPISFSLSLSLRLSVQFERRTFCTGLIHVAFIQLNLQVSRYFLSVSCSIEMGMHLMFMIFQLQHLFFRLDCFYFNWDHLSGCHKPKTTSHQATHNNPTYSNFSRLNLTIQWVVSAFVALSMGNRCEQSLCRFFVWSVLIVWIHTQFVPSVRALDLTNEIKRKTIRLKKRELKRIRMN